MDASLISKENILNLYDYINSELVKNYNFNSYSDDKYRKLVIQLLKRFIHSLIIKIKIYYCMILII